MSCALRCQLLIRWRGGTPRTTATRPAAGSFHTLCLEMGSSPRTERTWKAVQQAGDRAGRRVEEVVQGALQGGVSVTAFLTEVRILAAIAAHDRQAALAAWEQAMVRSPRPHAPVSFAGEPLLPPRPMPPGGDYGSVPLPTRTRQPQSSGCTSDPPASNHRRPFFAAVELQIEVKLSVGTRVKLGVNCLHAGGPRRGPHADAGQHYGRGLWRLPHGGLGPSCPTTRLPATSPCTANSDESCAAPAPPAGGVLAAESAGLAP